MHRRNYFSKKNYKINIIKRNPKREERERERERESERERERIRISNQ